MGACAHIDPLPSLSFGSTAASIPQSVNEVSVDPLRGTLRPVVTHCSIDPSTFRTRLSHVPCACAFSSSISGLYRDAAPDSPQRSL